MRNKNNKMLEVENRECPICGISIKIGEPLHRCDNKNIKKLGNKEKNKERTRTFDDKLMEFESYYDSESYYNNDNNEEE